MQPQKITTADFANKVRTKYPTGKASDGRMYTDIPDDELTQKIVEKFPVYKDKISDYGSFGAKQTTQNIIRSAQEGIDKIKSSYQEARMSDANPDMGIIEKTGEQLKGGLGIASGLASVVSSPITGAIKTLTDDFTNDPQVQGLTNSPAGTKIIDTLNTISGPIEKLRESNPESAKVLDDSLNVLFTLMGLKQTPATLKKFGEPFVEGTKALTKMPGEIKTSISGKPTAGSTAQVGSDLTKINEMIQPKPTVKQARLAQEQGRLYKGSEGGVFKEGTLDKVSASDQQARSTRTVKKYIDDAADLDQATLTAEIKNSVEELGRQLKPELQKVVIDEPIVNKINSSWKKIKTSQAEDAYSVLEPRMLKRMQTDFESRISKLKDGTLDDIWQARQAYDDSVGSNVRQATEQSSDILQAQKDIWIENRQVFTDALTDAENGLGPIAKQTFSDMRDLYEAKNGLLSKAKIETTSKPSKVEKFFDSKTGKALKYGAGATGVIGGAKAVLD